MNITDQLHPGRKFLRDIKSGVNISKETSFVLLRGIVVAINNETIQTQNSFRVPPYSLNLKIIGESTSSLEPKNDRTNWFSPFSPINFIILPEIGEEVLVIRETSTPKSVGFWIGRVNESAFLNRYLAKEWVNAEEPTIRYGFPFDVNDIQDIANGTSREKRFNMKALKPGDVSIQGRSGTYFIQSFDGIHKKGLLEFGIDDLKNEIINTPTGPKIIQTKKQSTSTTHIARSSLGDVSNLAFSSSAINKSIETSFIINKADRIINMSASGENSLYREVLGEKINKSIKDLIGEVKLLTKVLNENVKLIMDMMENHQHTFKGTEFKTDISIPIPDISKGSTTKHIAFNLKDQKVAKTEDIKPLTINAAVDSFNNKTSAIVADLENNLSKTQFIN